MIPLSNMFGSLEDLSLAIICSVYDEYIIT